MWGGEETQGQTLPLGGSAGAWDGVCFVFDERTAVKGAVRTPHPFTSLQKPLKNHCAHDTWFVIIWINMIVRGTAGRAEGEQRGSRGDRRRARAAGKQVSPPPYRPGASPG